MNKTRRYLLIFILLILFICLFVDTKENLSEDQLISYLKVVSPNEASQIQEPVELPSSCSIKYPDGTSKFGNQWTANIKNKRKYFCVPRNPSDYALFAKGSVTGSTALGSTTPGSTTPGSTGPGSPYSDNERNPATNCFGDKQCKKGFGCCFDGVTCSNEFGSNCQTCPKDDRNDLGCCSFANCGENKCCADGVTCNNGKCPTPVRSRTTNLIYTDCTKYDTDNINDPTNVSQFNEMCQDQVSRASTFVEFDPRTCNQPQNTKGGCSFVFPREFRPLNTT